MDARDARGAAAMLAAQFITDGLDRNTKNRQPEWPAVRRELLLIRRELIRQAMSAAAPANGNTPTGRAGG